MKSVLISIQPKWCELIAAGKKTVEVRKTKPNIAPPFKCYIYETKNTKDIHGFTILGKYRLGKVIGEFICDSIRKGKADNLLQAYYHNDPSATYLTDQELVLYASTGKPVYFLHVSDLEIYDEPKELGEFRSPPFKKCKLEYESANCSNQCVFNNNGSICSYRKVTRPPQSWCYMEVPE